jgi:hypothetical protein
VAQGGEDWRESRTLGTHAYRQIWDLLEAYLKSVVSDLRQDFPGIWTQIAGYPNPAFPFTGYASIVAEHDPSRTEDCVLMMEVARRPGRLIVTSDISTGNGELLATGPTFEITDTDPEEAQVSALRLAEKAIEEFFAANLDQVRRVLTLARDRDTT